MHNKIPDLRLKLFTRIRADLQVRLDFLDMRQLLPELSFVEGDAYFPGLGKSARSGHLMFVSLLS